MNTLAKKLHRLMQDRSEEKKPSRHTTIQRLNIIEEKISAIMNGLHEYGILSSGPFIDRLAEVEKSVKDIAFIKKRKDGDHTRVTQALEKVTAIDERLDSEVLKFDNYSLKINRMEQELKQLSVRLNHTIAHLNRLDDDQFQMIKTVRDLEKEVQRLGNHPVIEKLIDEDSSPKHQYPLTYEECFIKDSQGETKESKPYFDTEKLQACIDEIKSENKLNPSINPDLLLWRIKEIRQINFTLENTDLYGLQISKLCDVVTSLVENYAALSSIYNESKSKLPYNKLCDMVSGMQKIVNDLQARTSDQIIYGTISQVKHTPAYIQSQENETIGTLPERPLTFRRDDIYVLTQGEPHNTDPVFYQCTQDSGVIVLKTMNAVKDGVKTVYIYHYGSAIERKD